MAVQIEVKGPALIKIASPAGGSLEILGYTNNGVEITEEIYTGRVDGDQNGGEEGPPLDLQYFGEVHIVQMTLTKFDKAVLNKIRASYAGATAGTPGTPGTLMFQDEKAFRLLIASTNDPRNYTNVVFHRPKTLNVGTKHQRAIVVAECHKHPTTGVLYNATLD